MILAIITWLLIGAAAGWLAGLVMKGGGFGLLGNIAVGIGGAAVAGLVFPALGLVLVQVLAIGFHIMRKEPQTLPANLVLLALAAFVAWGRWSLF